MTSRFLLKSWFCKNNATKRLITSCPNTKDKPFEKVLIANRGEIACRIMNTCKRLGIKTVAVYSEADAQAKHVQMADEAVCIGPPPSKQSYLVIDKIVEACKLTGAQAVHPGYGFLSEKYQFYEKLENSGIIFIGPNKHALLAMGDKIESKKIGLKAKVNIIPGYDGVVEDVEKAIKLTKDIGYPVMLKASAGGGGKGMRVAYNDDEVRTGFRLSSQEAATSFNDDRLLIEKFVEDPRHIEIQVMGDNYGNVVYLNERECSIQRRNQKVIEEAPSSFLDAETRKAMGTQAVMLAKAVGYNSAGTVEFLVDKHRNFYFLEMNTRLQVEHPITELTTGLDIVELMLRSAAGQKLPIKQEDVTLKGWAVECRVYAEDPYKNFGLPSVGLLKKYIEPTHIPNVRCDSGIREGTDISIYYDSMICKLATYGKNREEALNIMDKALDSYVIRGVAHNISLLRDVCDNPRFREGKISTAFLPREYPEGFAGRKLSCEENDQLLSAAAFLFLKQEDLAGQFLNSKFRSPKISTTCNLFVKVNGITHHLIGSYDGKTMQVTVDGKRNVTFNSDSNTSSILFEAEVNGTPVIYQTLERKGQSYKIQLCGTLFNVDVLTQQQLDMGKFMIEKPKEEASPFLKTPMPGTIISVSCKVGDKVFEGQEVAVIEAMKLQNSLTISKTGIVKKIYVKPGQNLNEDDLILEISS
ncbi:propionyl-CoA carboxylase alpha chain, mitochondrial isoform X1 [Hydra vulgaris]|nr:propionyl-CoA carboxylase alpha chain, mitochondrial [Hydra vulgaris]